MPIIEVVPDFETASHTDLKKAGAWRYAECPTTEVLCLYFNVDAGEPVHWSPQDRSNEPALLALIANPDAYFIAQNCQFEKAIWRNIMVPMFGFPDIPNNRWHDTMAVLAMKCLPQDLERAAIVLRLPVEKDTEGSKITVAMSKTNKRGFLDRDPVKLQRINEYCAQDVRTQSTMHQRIGWLPTAERRTWLLDQRINERGIRLDMDYVHACQKVVDDASVPLLKEFRTITGYNVGQRDKVMGWLDSEGVRLPNMQKETLAAVLGEHAETDDGDEPDPLDIELPDHVRRALSIRQLVGSASIKKLARMEQCVCADGNARGLVQYHGSGTGRWAGRLFQPYNFPRGTLKLDGEAPDPQLLVDAIMTGDYTFVEMMFGPAVQAVVSGLRHTLIARAGRLFNAGDYSTIEARLVLALAGQNDKTALLAAGADPYVDMAQAIYKRPIDKKKDPEERQTGKNSVLGLGFQMGWRKFKLKYAPKMPDEFAQQVVYTYRKEWAPKVPYVWYGIEDAACKAVWDGTKQEAYGVVYQREDAWLTARLPSGRKLWYFNPRPIKKPAPWDADEIKPAWTYQTMKMGQWRTIDAYGGLLTENVVQAMARDILVSAMFKAEANNLPCVLTVYDEIVTEPLAADADPKLLKQIMCDVDPWVRELGAPINAETWIGSRYKK